MEQEIPKPSQRDTDDVRAAANQKMTLNACKILMTKGKIELVEAQIKTFIDLKEKYRSIIEELKEKNQLLGEGQTEFEGI